MMAATQRDEMHRRAVTAAHPASPHMGRLGLVRVGACQAGERADKFGLRSEVAQPEPAATLRVDGTQRNVAAKCAHRHGGLLLSRSAARTSQRASAKPQNAPATKMKPGSDRKDGINPQAPGARKRHAPTRSRQTSMSASTASRRRPGAVDRRLAGRSPRGPTRPASFSHTRPASFYAPWSLSVKDTNRHLEVSILGRYLSLATLLRNRRLKSHVLAGVVILQDRHGKPLP